MTLDYYCLTNEIISSSLINLGILLLSMGLAVKAIEEVIEVFKDYALNFPLGRIFIETMSWGA